MSGSEDGECDLVEVVADKPERLVQVCWELTPDNEGREIGGLTAAMRFSERTTAPS
ncbi:MAG: hypothetical protein ACOYD3_06875 [Kiritimatiellia bacterium]